MNIISHTHTPPYDLDTKSLCLSLVSHAAAASQEALAQIAMSQLDSVSAYKDSLAGYVISVHQVTMVTQHA